MIQKIILILTILALATANLHLNFKYRNVLEGPEPLTQRLAQEIYMQFKSPYFQRSEYRFKIFYETLQKIKQHNSGRHTWKQGINDFSDMTSKQFKESRLMAPQECSATNFLSLKPEFQKVSFPDSYEWNNLKMVSPVKDQGNCGSCWAFSTVGALESHWNILGKGRNVTFSEQQLVDCAGDFENYGCDGGLPSQAFQYIKHVGGIESDATYPYIGTDNKCVHRPEISVGYVRHGSYNITQGDQNQLAQRIYNAGPVSVAFQVVDSLQNYVGGVYTDPNCGKTTLDVNHAVLATGYGVENGMKYWNIKNSWSERWGINGYFKIERGNNICAIAQCNSYPLIDQWKDFEVKTNIKNQ